ncbi:LysR family transcriptional regulator, partial [Pasteurellaceae bacterium UScroc12]
MDFGLLRAFLVLSTTNSYRTASDRLFITQSTLTKQINKLEYKLQLKLFDRGRRGAHLTQAGAFILPFAQDLLLKKEVSKNLKNGGIGHLYIGFGLSTFNLAPSMIYQFRKKYPEVIITLNDIPSSVQIECLKSGELSLGFLRLPVPATLKQLPLLDDKLVLVVNSLIDSTTDPLEIIESYPFLSLTGSRGPGLNFQISQFLKFNKISINRINNSDDIQTLLAMISSGIGISILPESTILLGVENIKT